MVQRYERVTSELAEVCRAAGRNLRDVTLIGVSKTVGPDVVGEAVEAGLADFGENRPDQIMLKHDLYPQVNWHFIGNIQSRRIRDIVGRATLVHSLCKLEHARKIDEIAQAQGIVQDVLIEVNVSGELSKDGIAPSEAQAFLDACHALPAVRVRGLMTMAPQGDLTIARQTFLGLAQLREELQRNMDAQDAALFTELSMGMSEDWREAVAAGATMVRIGRALFSDEF